jgi:hypothetical protein
LLTGVNANGSGDRLRFFAGDTARVELHLVRLTGDSAFPAEAVSFADWLDAAASVSLAVGPLETEPTSGTYRVEFDGDLSDPIAASASASAVEAALNDIPSVASLGGVAVTKVGEFYRVEFDSPPPDEFTFDASALVPRSTVVTSTPTVGGAARLFRIRQVPVALATTWAAVPSASASLSVVSAWNGTSSTVRLTIAEARGGSFNLNFKSVAGVDYPFNLIPSDASGTSLAGFLNPEASTLGGTVSVRQIGVGVFDISTPVQPFGVGSDGWTVDGSGLDSFVGLVGDLDFNTVEAETLLDGADSVEVTVEVEAVGGGRYFTAYQDRADLAADLVDNGPLGPVVLDTPLGTAEAASLYVTQAFAAANYLTALTGAGLFLSKSLNLSDIPSPSTARANLGLGTIATESASDFLSKAGNLSGLGDASASRSNLGLGSIATASASDYLAKADNLSGLASTSTARTNLGLGTMATETATNYLAKSGNLSGLASTSTARTNLGLGSIATETATNYLAKADNLSGLASTSTARTNLGLGSDATGSNLSALTNAATARTNLGLGTIATFNDAPSDGSQYARKNGAWDVVTAGGGGGSVTVNTYATPGTYNYTVPAGAKYVTVWLWASGGGGGSGARQATTSARGGASGGAGGAFCKMDLIASSITSPVTIVVPAGGAGGAAVTANSTNGNAGSPGGHAQFGNLIAHLGSGGTAGSTTGGSAAGQRSSLWGFATVAGVNSGIGSAAGAGGSSGTITPGAHFIPSSGGGGAGQLANNTTAALGGNGASKGAAGANIVSGWNVVISSGLGGSNPGTAPTNGNNGTTTLFGGGGGGGGGYTTAIAGQAGAAGNFPGGGGGGGSASDNGFNSGAGGNGGNGLVIVVAW